MEIVSGIVWGVAWQCFEWPYADEHPLALEVDVGDGELAGERHGCGDGCVCLFWKSSSSPVICIHNC